MNVDRGAAVHTCPLNFGPDGAGYGRFYRTASGECIPGGGAWRFQHGYDKNGWSRSLKEDSRVYTKFDAVREKLFVKIKIYCWGLAVVS